MLLLTILLTFVAVVSGENPLIIAHRGSSGMLPEHTREAYELAIEQGADIIECDVSITSDFHLVCVHESWLAHTTDVAERAEFQHKKRMAKIPGIALPFSDWFTVDFTLAELKTLRKVQQHAYRNQSYNGLYEIATLEEYIDIAKRGNVGIYPEIKDPVWINKALEKLGSTVRFEDRVVNALHAHGYTTKDALCFIQSFDEKALYYTKTLTDLPLVMLITDDVDDSTLDQWGQAFYGVGPWKDQIVPSWSLKNGYKNPLGVPTDLVDRLHSRGLKIHPYTFREEDQYLSDDYNQDINAEYELFIKLGVDGLFTDFPKSLAVHLQDCQ